MESMIAAAERRNWLDLPVEVMSMILVKLGVVEILINAQNVCSLWRKICKDPLMWRVIDMSNIGLLFPGKQYLNIMCKHAVDRSCGQLLNIYIVFFGTDDLLQYISQSSNQLRRLQIVDCYSFSDKGVSKAISKFPFLEHLRIITRSCHVETLKTVGRCCPLLKSLNLNLRGRGDVEALTIAETLPKLLHLQLSGYGLTNSGLHAILDGCPVLESLDLQNCYNLKLGEEMEKRCAERIKILHLPHNSPETDFVYYEDYSRNSDYEDYSDD